MGLLWSLCYNNDAEHRIVLEALRKVVTTNSAMVCIGDFNVILSSSDKKGGVDFLIKLSIKAFQECVSSCGLIDMGFSGPDFTWCNNQQGRRRVWVRLDRALCNAEWRLIFPDAHVTHLAQTGSDHCPIVLHCACG